MKKIFERKTLWGIFRLVKEGLAWRSLWFVNELDMAIIVKLETLSCAVPIAQKEKSKILITVLEEQLHYARRAGWPKLRWAIGVVPDMRDLLGYIFIE